MARLETWEELQARLFHLGWLGEELPEFVAYSQGAWLYRQIAREAAKVAAIAAEYVAETEYAALACPPNCPARDRRDGRGTGGAVGPVPDMRTRRCGGGAL